MTATARFVRAVAVPAGIVRVSPPPERTNHACAEVASAPGALRTAESVALSPETADASGSPRKANAAAIEPSPAQSSETVADQVSASPFCV